MAHGTQTTAQSQRQRRPMPWLVQLVSFTAAIGIIVLTLGDQFSIPWTVRSSLWPSDSYLQSLGLRQLPVFQYSSLRR